MNNINKSTGQNKKKVKSTRKSGVKLDEIIKLLFNVSKPLLIDTLNGLFNEVFNPNDVDINISKTATEFVPNNLDIIRGDMFLQITDGLKPYHYHIEYQTNPAGDMVLRMFEYDIQKALDNMRVEGDNTSKITLYMPKSLVIHIEESNLIPDKYTLDIVFANGSTQEYIVDVMKYWTFDDTKLIDRKLYNLLPLQVFLLRSELDRMTKNKDEQARQTAILKAKNITEKIANEIMRLSYDENKIGDDDADKIMIGLQEIFKHLNGRYKVNTKLDSEVEDMVKSLIDKKSVEKRAKEIAEQLAEQRTVELVKEMLLDNEPIEKIVKYTKLTENEIKDIQKTLTNEK